MLAAACRILSQCLPRKFLPKTICSSDYGGGSHTGPLLFALLIVRILPATSGERGGVDIWHIWSQLSIWCLSLGYLFNIFPRGSLSIRLRRAVASAQPRSRLSIEIVGDSKETAAGEYFKEEYRDIIRQVSGYLPKTSYPLSKSDPNTNLSSTSGSSQTLSTIIWTIYE